MAGEFDKVKGRTKKAAGDLTDNDKLKREGYVDDAAGKAKSFFEKVSDTVQGWFTKVADWFKKF